jgi:hypothetical protein
VPDAFADLSGHELHPLRQVPGERLGFVPGSFPQRRGVARVGVERHRTERNDREDEERDDEAKAQVHDVEQARALKPDTRRPTPSAIESASSAP